MGWFQFLEKEEEKSFMKEFEEALPSLTYQQRLTGFAICFGLGWVTSFLSAAFLPRITTPTGAAMFALFYTLGNLISIFSSCFLWGPCAQFKAMVECHRLFATSMYFAAMFMTLFCAFYQQEGYTSDARLGAVLVCMFLQFLAMCWYTISFIPFARAIIKRMVAACFRC
ncbi:hypothetical protein AAMO2058_000578500 [Amorphochlora amoebiformis]